MRRAWVVSLGAMLLALGLSGGREALCEEADEFQPEEIRIGRIEALDAPFGELAKQLEQGSGMKITLGEELAGRTVYLRLNDVSLKSILETALPSQGATWELEAGSALRLSALSGPWTGPADTPRSATPPGTSRLLNFRSGDLRVQALVDRLGRTYLSNLLCDYRIEQRAVRLELTQASFEEALGKLCAVGGWSWRTDGEIVVLLPSTEAGLLNLPALHWRNWVFEALTGSDVAQELAADFDIPVHLSTQVAQLPFTGHIWGRTLGEVVEDFCRQNYCAYAVFNRTLFIAQSSESFRFRGDAVPPPLEIELELVNIPGDRWMHQRIQRIVTSAAPLSPQEREEQMEQLRRIASAETLLKHRLTLESAQPREVRLEPDSGEKGEPILLWGRFHYLNRDHARLELTAASESPVADAPALKASVDVDALPLKQPYLACSELQFPDTERSSVVVFYLKFTVDLPADETTAVYRPTVWHVPRGEDRRRDLSNEYYYSRFPGEWSSFFLPHPFRGPSTRANDKRNEND